MAFKTSFRKLVMKHLNILLKSELLNSHIFPLTCFQSSYIFRGMLECVDGNSCMCVVASGPATPDSVESIAQHLSPESSRKAYWRTWDGQSTPHPSTSVFTDATPSHAHLKSPATGRSRSVSDSSAPRRGTHIHASALGLFQKYI